jgi:hypothetical protein
VQPVAHLEHSERLAGFFDVPPAAARTILEKASNPAAWAASPLPGITLLHLAPGPAFAGADAGLVRFDGGVQVPLHDHEGQERTLVLSGGMTFADGSTLAPGGAPLVMQRGQKHAFTAAAEGCLYAVTLYGGIYIEGIGRIGTRS